MPAGSNAYNSLWQVRIGVYVEKALEIAATTRPAPPPDPIGPAPASAAPASATAATPSTSPDAP